jgi:membrane-associated protein
MDTLPHFFNFLLHLDNSLDILIQVYGIWVYLLFFVIIFCEIGLVMAPFLPGDSLLFAAGMLAARGVLDVGGLLIVFGTASILGDTVNYWLGYFVGPRVFHKEKSFIFNKKYLTQTQEFYQKHGAKTIVLARFVPIVRTFAPFVAGIGKMHYERFISYNVFGGILWTGVFVLSGYFFGNIPWIKEHFTLVVLGVIILSLLPFIFKLKNKFKTY